MKRVICGILLVTFAAITCFSQPTFATILRNTSEIGEYGHDVVQAPDGGFVFTGSVAHPARSDEDIVIGKFSSSGHLLWAKTIGGTSFDSGKSIIKKGGFYYVVGELRGYAAGYTNIALIKFDEVGTISWVKVAVGTDIDYAQQIINTSDGGFAIGGTIYDGENANDFAILKFDSADNLQWMNRIGTVNHENAYSLAETGNGKFVLCGFSWSGATPSTKVMSNNIMIAKLSSTGTLELAKIFYDDRNEIARAVVPTPDNGYAVFSEVRLWDFGQSDVLISKFNSSDILQWSKIIGAFGYEATRSAIRTSDGGYLISGDFSLVRGIQAGILKLNSAFEIEWTRGGGRGETDYGFGVIQTADGGFAQIGSSSNSSIMELMIIKYNSSGRYCQPDSQTLSSLDVTVDFENITFSENRDLMTIETISPEITVLSPAESLLCEGLEIAERELPVANGLFVAPNPFNSAVTIYVPSPAVIEIIDLSGRVVEIIDSRSKEEVVWAPSESVVSGVYFVRARYFDNSVERQQILYLK